MAGGSWGRRTPARIALPDVVRHHTLNVKSDIAISGELHLGGAFPKVNLKAGSIAMRHCEGEILYDNVVVLPLMNNTQIRHGTNDPLNLIKMPVVAELSPRCGDGHGRVCP